jgi:hypothetical protein
MSWRVIAVKDKWAVTWQLCCGRGSTNGSLKAELLRELACCLVVTRCRWGRWGERLWRIGLAGTSRSSWTGQRSYGRQLLLWWSLLSTLCCKLPPASSTIAALENKWNLFSTYNNSCWRFVCQRSSTSYFQSLGIIVGFQISTTVRHHLRMDKWLVTD